MKRSDLHSTFSWTQTLLYLIKETFSNTGKEEIAVVAEVYVSFMTHST